MWPMRVDDDLTLEELGPAQARAWLDLVEANRPHLERWLRHMADVRTLEDARTFLRREADQHESWYLGLWVNGELAGSLKAWRDRREKSCGFGYWLGKAHQGSGLVTRACRAAIAHFAATGTHRFEIRCGTDNTASRRVAERLGFTHEGTLRDAQFLHGGFISHDVYGLLATELS